MGIEKGWGMMDRAEKLLQGNIRIRGRKIMVGIMWE